MSSWERSIGIFNFPRNLSDREATEYAELMHLLELISFGKVSIRRIWLNDLVSFSTKSLYVDIASSSSDPVVPLIEPVWQSKLKSSKNRFHFLDGGWLSSRSTPQTLFSSVTPIGPFSRDAVHCVDAQRKTFSTCFWNIIVLLVSGTGSPPDF